MTSDDVTLTLDAVGGEKGDVAGFQGVVMGTVRGPGLGFRFARQGRVVHLDRENFLISVCEHR